MYQEYFQLTRLPFTISPDPSFLYPSHQCQDALAHLAYGLQREGGFILLTGEVGTGKTTICRTFLQQLDDSVSVAYVLNTKLDTEDVLASICTELGVNCQPGNHSPRYYIELLNIELLQAHGSGQKTLVVIEEAQNLAPEVLEVLRLLTNLETNTSKLLHILLVGQPELLDTLARKDLRQLNQRVVARCHLGALSFMQAKAYIKHRLRCAGQSESVLFSMSACWLIYRYSGGIPRLINLLADRSLLGAYSRSRNNVSAGLVREANAQIAMTQRGARRGSVFRFVGFTALLALMLLAGSWLDLSRFSFWLNMPASVAQQHEPATDLQYVPPRAIASSVALSVVESILQSESQPQASVQSKAAVHRLQELWGLPVGGSIRTLCSDLPGQFSCLRISNAEFIDIEHYNRPAVVTLVSELGVAEQLMIAAIDDTAVTVFGLAGEKVLTSREFIAAWDSSLWLLWNKPDGFSKWLKPGDKSPEMVAWLNQKLQLLNENSEELVTGGRYSQALVEQVAQLQRAHNLKPDGILGEKTIMLINSLLASPPVLNGGAG
jgi:general secretion pathway protein A